METKNYISALKTVLVITVGFVIIYMICECMWALWVAVAVGFSGMVSTYLAVRIDFLWKQLAKLLNFIVPNIILTLVFFIILLPVALLSRLFTKKDQLHLKNTPGSLFEKSDKSFDPSSFEKPW